MNAEQSRLEKTRTKKLPGSGHLAYSKGVFRGKGLKIVAACADREAAPKGLQKN